jgi:hypothetical protein
MPHFLNRSVDSIIERVDKASSNSKDFFAFGGTKVRIEGRTHNVSGVVQEGFAARQEI